MADGVQGWWSRLKDPDMGVLAGFGLILVLALSAFLIADTVEDRNKAIEAARLAGAGRARILAQRLDAISALVGHIGSDIASENETLLNRMLADIPALAPQFGHAGMIRQMMVFDAAGHYRTGSLPGIASDGIDCSRCRSFVELRDGKRQSLFGADFGDVPGVDGVIGLGRRLSDATGDFAGMVLIIVDMDGLMAEFGTDDSAIFAMTADRGVVAWWPVGAKAAARPLPAAEFSGLDALAPGAGHDEDLVTGDTIFAMHRLNGQPLWIGVADRLDTINAETAQDLLIALGLSLATALAVTIFCLAVGRQITRRRRAERSLAAARDQLELRVQRRTTELEQEIRDRKAVEITLRQSESRFLHFMGNTPTGAYIVDQDGRLTYLNRRLAQWLDTDGAAALGKTFWELLPEDLAAQWEEHDQAVLVDRQPVSQEYVFRRCDGQQVWLADKFPLGSEPDNSLIGGVIMDVSAHRAAEVELHHAHRMEALGQLASGVTHDINNLLTIILGNLEIIEEIADPASDIQAYAREARWAARRGGHLTDRLLALSRRRAPVAELTDVNLVVANMAELLRRTLGKEICTTITPASAPAMALIDINRLENAILNLCLNARDAMPRGGTLEIKVESRDFADPPLPALAAGGFVVVSVSDTGGGMEAEVIERACNPFFTTKGAGKGTGLGLSMVKGFAGQSGGGLEIVSQPDQGTCVILYFPRREAPAPSAAALDGTPAGEGAIPAVVLVVEDKLEVRRLAVNALLALGCTVFEAVDAEQALALLAHHSGATPGIDLVFSDIMMPGGMNGVQLAHEIAERWPHLRILLTSGYPDGGVEPGRGEIGFPFLRKPYDSQALAEAIRQIGGG